MEEFGILESSEKMIAILGDRWWPQTAKQDGDRISKQFLRNIRKKRNERPNVGGVYIRMNATISIFHTREKKSEGCPGVG